MGVMLIALLLVSGCGQNDELKTLNCTLGVTVQEGLRVESDYKVSYKGENVTLIETTEKVISDDEDYLELYKEQVESLYSPFKDVEHYNYSVKVDGNTLTSTTSIDYEKIDTDELVQINSAIGNLLEDGKLKVEDVQTMYESVGATCK